MNNMKLSNHLSNYFVIHIIYVIYVLVLILVAITVGVINAEASYRTHIINEKEKIKIEFSSSDTNRIAVKDGMLSGIYGAGDKLSYEIDEITGQIFFKSKIELHHPITLSLITTDNEVQEIEASFVQKQGETLILIPSKQKKDTESIGVKDSNNAESKLTVLMKDILVQNFQSMMLLDKKESSKKTRQYENYTLTPKLITASNDITAILYDFKLTNRKFDISFLKEEDLYRDGDKSIMILRTKDSQDNFKVVIVRD
jgi:hypothetical protein